MSLSRMHSGLYQVGALTQAVFFFPFKSSTQQEIVCFRHAGTSGNALWGFDKKAAEVGLPPPYTVQYGLSYLLHEFYWPAGRLKTVWCSVWVRHLPSHLSQGNVKENWVLQREVWKVPFQPKFPWNFGKLLLNLIAKIIILELKAKISPCSLILCHFYCWVLLQSRLFMVWTGSNVYPNKLAGARYKFSLQQLLYPLCHALHSGIWESTIHMWRWVRPIK